MLLATVDATVQPTAAGKALIFNDTPLVSGNSISHTAGTSNVEINQPGIYQATFHGTASVTAGTSYSGQPDSPPERKRLSCNRRRRYKNLTPLPAR